MKVYFADADKFVYPRIEYYVQDEVIRRVGILYGTFHDIYLIPEKIGEKRGIFTVKVNPLTSFIWIGSLIMLGGGMLSLTPRAILNRLVGVRR